MPSVQMQMNSPEKAPRIRPMASSQALDLTRDRMIGLHTMLVC
jgi:hypothetical protein